MKHCRKWKSIILAVMLILGVIALTACGDSIEMKRVGVQHLSDHSAESLKRLGDKRVFFGHQSVGANIMDGVKDLLVQGSVPPLRVLETKDGGSVAGPFLAHAKIGANRDPRSKILDFSEIVAAEGADFDVALMKFCYVDVVGSTDVEALFSEYRQAIDTLRTRSPSTTFVHVTVPLRVVQTGPKALLKRLLGRPVGGEEDNIARMRFNELLRGTYGGKESIFDLAAAEAADSEGVVRMQISGRGQFESLLPVYSDDGGHLNEKGRQTVASRMLAALAETP